jgi:hypothetical protein
MDGGILAFCSSWFERRGKGWKKKAFAERQGKACALPFPFCHWHWHHTALWALALARGALANHVNFSPSACREEEILCSVVMNPTGDPITFWVGYLAL